jgi:choline kinase
MNTNTHTTTPAKPKAMKPGKAEVKIIKDLAQASIQKVVVVAPGGHKEDFDDRVYQCLRTGCGNRGTVRKGHFHREGKGYTICNSCGTGENRWVREAAV